MEHTADDHRHSRHSGDTKRAKTNGNDDDVVNDDANAATTLFTVAADGAHISYPAELPPAGLYQNRVGMPQECVVVNGFKSLTDKHVKAYVDIGFIIVKNGITADRVQSALAAIDKICEERDDVFEAACKSSVITDPDGPAKGYDGPGLQFEAAGADRAQGDRSHFVRKLKNFHTCNDTLAKISYHQDMLSVVSNLIHGFSERDTESTQEDLAIFQSLALLKPPKVGREKPWHQDNAYFNVEPIQSKSGAPTAIVGIWMALDEATHDNGCMYVVPGSHKQPQLHFQKRDWQICDDQISSNSLVVPMKPGDTLFFSSLLWHGTPPNLSDFRRRALQFHVLPKEYPRCTTAQRLKMFGAAGSGVEC